MVMGMSHEMIVYLPSGQRFCVPPTVWVHWPPLCFSFYGCYSSCVMFFYLNWGAFNSRQRVHVMHRNSNSDAGVCGRRTTNQGSAFQKATSITTTNSRQQS